MYFLFILNCSLRDVVFTAFIYMSQQVKTQISKKMNVSLESEILTSKINRQN